MRLSAAFKPSVTSLSYACLHMQRESTKSKKIEIMCAHNMKDLSSHVVLLSLVNLSKIWLVNFKKMLYIVRETLSRGQNIIASPTITNISNVPVWTSAPLAQNQAASFYIVVATSSVSESFTMNLMDPFLNVLLTRYLNLIIH